jgi:hypothetical protein
MLLLVLHVAVTGYLTGLIWVVQRVHYPLFRRVSSAEFAASHHEHTRRITVVVAPAMLLEAGTAVWIALRPPAGVAAALSWLGLALVVVIWLSTTFVQVPLHRRLASGFESGAHRALVRGNWIRTAAWSARLAIAVGMLVQAVR